MPKIVFQPDGEEVEVPEDMKILAAAIRNKIQIRYGCASCRCGTCGVKIDTSEGEVKPMKASERDLLQRMSLSIDGAIRLACQTRVVQGTVRVDLDFQTQYSPDRGEYEET